MKFAVTITAEINLDLRDGADWAILEAVKKGDTNTALDLFIDTQSNPLLGDIVSCTAYPLEE